MRRFLSLLIALSVFGSCPLWARAADAEKKPAEAKKTEETKEKAEAKKAEPEKKKLSVVRLALRGALPEGPASQGLFGDMQVSLSTLIERLDEAAGDKAVAAVWLRIEGVAVGRGKINEIRQAIARVRAAGKPVVAELTSAEAAQYLIASACEKIVMPPSGALMLPGVRAELTFYKGMLDKLGVEFDMLQMGKYKGAAEPMTRTGMSDALRENMTAIVDDVYEQLAATIAADRNMKDHQVKTLIDQGLFSASAALKARLIDQIAYSDQLEESLRKQLKADEVKIVTNYKKKQVDTDFSGISGFMKLMELMMGGKPSEVVGKGKRVAVVYAVGPIMEGKSESDLFGDSTVGSTTLVEALQKANKDPKVVAIVLRVDSPGGSAIASDLIWRETEQIEKPIIASMGDVAGSGGYYIAMGADKIVAEPGTITGSIGVVGGKVVLKGLLDKVGVTTEVVSRGEMSGAMSVSTKFSPEERKAWNGLMQDIYRQFVDKAARGRKMPRQQLESLAQGRIYTGQQALDNGLIDQLGTLRDAIVEAKLAAGLKADEEVDIQVLPQPKTIFEQLLGGDDLSGEMALALPELGLPEMASLLRRAKTIRAMFAEPTLVWMPFDIRLK
jgi:protease-4